MRAGYSDFGCIFGETDEVPSVDALTESALDPIGCFRASSDFGVDPGTGAVLLLSAVVGVTAFAHNILAIHHFMKEPSPVGGIKG
jgi:hypothetical protein